MLKTIVHPSVKLVEFIIALKLALYQPQINHLQRIADALIVCDRRKTLTNLYREFVEELNPKTAADFFRESPWQAKDVGQSQRAYMLSEYLRLMTTSLSKGVHSRSARLQQALLIPSSNVKSQ